MENRQDTLQQYVSDMLSLSRHIHEALSRQVDDKATDNHPDAAALIRRLETTLTNQVEDQKRRLEGLGGDSASPVKEAVTAALGVAAGLIDEVRTQKVSKMLRDDYTALSLAAISLTMLHTTGLALSDPMTADMATRHLKELTPLIVEISEVIPHVVVRELQDDTEGTVASVGDQATSNTQEAWTSEHTHEGHLHS